MKKIILFLAATLLLSSCNIFHDKNEVLRQPLNQESLEFAYFAWGCFWCMEWIYEWQEGVFDAVSGYIWWKELTANYNLVSTWKTGHREAVKVIYDPEIIDYPRLVELYWTQIDPTDPEWQFADRWFHYTTAIYYANDEEKAIAEASKKALSDSKKFDKPIVTSIIKATPFYDAEEYHQDYAKKQTLKYKTYEKGSGRADFKEDVWSEQAEKLESSTWKTQAELKARLTPLQYKVTQQGWTETPFDNPYWDNKKQWIYVDIIDGTPLYSSLDKYKSWTGWPSFTKPIAINSVWEREDNTLFSKRTEIVWEKSGAHIGHVFTDGPEDKWWLRYCMNSAAMKFISVDDLEEQGYWEYVKTFQ